MYVCLVVLVIYPTYWLVLVQKLVGRENFLYICRYIFSRELDAKRELREGE